MENFDTGTHQAYFSQLIIDEAIKKAHHVKALIEKQQAGESVGAVEIDKAIDIANRDAIEAAKFIKLVGDDKEQLKQAIRLLSPEKRW